MITFAICDDEPLMVRELSDYLVEYMKEKSTTNYSVSSFSDGRALLERFENPIGVFQGTQKRRHCYPHCNSHRGRIGGDRFL